MRLVPRKTPTTHAPLHAIVGCTHPREIKLAERTIQESSTLRFPITCTRPRMNAEWG